MRNPFIPGTLSYKFFEHVSFHNTPRTAKSLFNHCGQTIEGAQLANHILKRDRWLYVNASNPKRMPSLKDKIAWRPQREVDKKIYTGQLANTARWEKMREEKI